MHTSVIEPTTQLLAKGQSELDSLCQTSFWDVGQVVARFYDAVALAVGSNLRCLRNRDFALVPVLVHAASRVLVVRAVARVPVLGSDAAISSSEVSLSATVEKRIVQMEFGPHTDMLCLLVWGLQIEAWAVLLLLLLFRLLFRLL